MLMGRKLVLLCLSFHFLRMRMIMASFQLVGNVPVLQDWLYNDVQEFLFRHTSEMTDHLIGNAIRPWGFLLCLFCCCCCCCCCVFFFVFCLFVCLVLLLLLLLLFFLSDGAFQLMDGELRCYAGGGDCSCNRSLVFILMSCGLP